MVVLIKKTFEVSRIESVDEINALSLALNEQEQVSHMKINKDNIVFSCIDIDALSPIIHGMNKEYIVKEVVDGKKREYDFARVQDVEHYFMFKNLLVEDDISLFLSRIKQDKRYKDIHFDGQNKMLTLVSNKKDVLSYLRKELFRINPSIEIIEHRKPIRSQDVFNEKYLHRYIYIGILLVIIALALITAKDHSRMTPILWLVTMLTLAWPLMKKVWQNIKQKQFFKEDVLIFLACLMGIASQAYIETCIAVVLYQVASPLLNKMLERCLNKIDRTVEMPEKGLKYENDEIEEISLYDFEIGDIMVVPIHQTVTIPGKVIKGESSVSTYSNTSTYELLAARQGTHLRSGYVNVGEERSVRQD